MDEIVKIIRPDDGGFTVKRLIIDDFVEMNKITSNEFHIHRPGNIPFGSWIPHRQIPTQTQFGK